VELASLGTFELIPFLIWTQTSSKQDAAIKLNVDKRSGNVIA
jgi:hypothetical protein